MPAPVLFQFALSHYNEKARWALDYKGIPHVRRSLLPGPHKLKMMRISGQDQVPVLCDGEEVIAGSNRILAHLEAKYPTPTLLPEDPVLRERALAWERDFDERVGPPVRLARFHATIGDADYFASQFTMGRSAFVQGAYRATFPLVRSLMVRQMQLTKENALQAERTTEAALLRVAEGAGPAGYLVGEAFSLADLTAASLLMPAVNPAGGPTLPPPTPEARAWEQRWEDHPGSAWVREIYARHRGKSAEVPG